MFNNIVADEMETILMQNKKMVVLIMEKIIAENRKFVSYTCQTLDFKQAYDVYIQGIDRNCLNGKNKRKLREQVVTIIELYVLYTEIIKMKRLTSLQDEDICHLLTIMTLLQD